MVRKYLEGLPPILNEDEKAARRKSLMAALDAIRTAHPDFDASDRLTREELHDRNAFRGH